jgi:organic hydroperoxide reductase OsmC/OhrA
MEEHALCHAGAARPLSAIRHHAPEMPCALTARRSHTFTAHANYARREGRAMREFPHYYAAVATGGPDGDIQLDSGRLTGLRSAAPAEFDGPGDRWSPETLVVAAVADCYVLTFRALARGSKLPWLALRCDASGMLDRVGRVTQFTAFSIKVSLGVPSGTDVDQARRLLVRAEEGCLISNSLKAPVHVEVDVRIERDAPVACVVPAA